MKVLLIEAHGSFAGTNAQKLAGAVAPQGHYCGETLRIRTADGRGYIYALPGELHSALHRGPISVNDNFRASLVDFDPAGCTAEGEAAGLWNAARVTAGIEPRLPELSRSWVRAIEEA